MSRIYSATFNDADPVTSSQRGRRFEGILYISNAGIAIFQLTGDPGLPDRFSFLPEDKGRRIEFHFYSAGDEKTLGTLRNAEAESSGPMEILQAHQISGWWKEMYSAGIDGPN
jgi:hypothetical protein